ncbi:MAG: holo-ACP synthase [Rickettsiales bacterium]
MIIGIGNDIISIARIAKLLQSKKDQFIQKIFTDKEAALLNQIISEDKIIGYVANRFAAKEALAKALGTGFGKYFSFKDVSVLKTPQGKPYFEYNQKLKNYIQEIHKSDFQIYLTMSNEKEYAQAFVVIETI